MIRDAEIQGQILSLSRSGSDTGVAGAIRPIVVVDDWPRQCTRERDGQEHLEIRPDEDYLGRGASAGSIFPGYADSGSRRRIHAVQSRATDAAHGEILIRGLYDFAETSPAISSDELHRTPHAVPLAHSEGLDAHARFASSVRRLRESGFGVRVSSFELNF